MTVIKFLQRLGWDRWFVLCPGAPLSIRCFSTSTYNKRSWWVPIEVWCPATVGVSSNCPISRHGTCGGTFKRAAAEAMLPSACERWVACRGSCDGRKGSNKCLKNEKNAPPMKNLCIGGSGTWAAGRLVSYTPLCNQAHQKFDRLGSCQVNMSKAGASGRNDDRPGSPSLSFRRGTCVRVWRITLCGGSSRIRRGSSRWLGDAAPTLTYIVAVALGCGVYWIIISEMCDWQPWLCLENTKPFRATFGGKRCPEALDAATSFQYFFSGQTSENIKFEHDAGFP